MAPRTTTFATGSFNRTGSGAKVDTGRQIKNVVTNLKNIFSELKKNQIQAALKEMGEEIIKETTPLVPVQDGSLRDSAKLVVDPNPNNPKVTVSYGGQSNTPGRNAPTGFVDYAVLVHEDNREHAIGQWKYLQTGAQLAVPKLEAIMAKHVKAKLK